MTHATQPAMATTRSDDIPSRILALLAALARPGAVLVASGNSEDPVAIVISSRGEADASSAAFASEDVEAASSQGWIEPASEGWGWKITRAGAAIVRAARASRIAVRAAVSEPCSEALVKPSTRSSAERLRDSRQASARETAREAGGSLGWLHSRRDKDGQPLISVEQLAAGERLAGDLWRARMTPRVTSVWTGVPGDAGSRRAAPGAGVDIADGVIAAKVRVERALKAVGPEFAGPLIDVCGHMRGLDDIERINGLPMRSGKMLLGTALTRLARHYGLLPPEHGEAEIARCIAGWMAADGAVTLDAWQGDRAPAVSSPSPRSYGEKAGMRGSHNR